MTDLDVGAVLTQDETATVIACLASQLAELDRDIQATKSELAREAIRVGMQKVGLLKLRLENGEPAVRDPESWQAVAREGRRHA